MNRGVNLGRLQAQSRAHPRVCTQRSLTAGSTGQSPSWQTRLIENANAASLKPYQVMAGIALGGLGATLGGALYVIALVPEYHHHHISIHNFPTLK